MFLVQAKPLEDAPTYVVAGCDYVVYAIDGRSLDEYWIGPFFDLDHLNPAPARSFEKLTNQPEDWIHQGHFLAPLKIARGAASLIEGLFEGDATAVKIFRSLRISNGDTSTEDAIPVMDRWKEGVESGRFEAPTPAALALAGRANWLSPWSDEQLAFGPEERIGARRYWGEVFSSLCASGRV